METIRHIITKKALAEENRHFSGTGGISQNNKNLGFVPAFLDSSSGRVYRSCFSDGTPAPIHIYDGLPEHTIIKRDSRGVVISIRHDIISGFEKEGYFYTREQAANYVSSH